MIDAPPTNPNDRDSDGVANDVDNCPDIANPGQGNEDMDSRGDECDPCPQFSTPGADVDSDGDGVGNGCDPNMTTGGDVLAYWNGFHVDGPLPAAFTMVHGQAARWAVSGGDLVFTPNNDDWGMPTVDAGGTSHTTDSTFQIVQSFSGTASAAGVAVDIALNDTQVYECQARTDAGQREMWRRDLTDSDGWTLVDSRSVTTGNETYRFYMQRTAGSFTCTNTRMGFPSVVMSSARPTLGNTRAGLFARNVNVRFRYIAVYRSP